MYRALFARDVFAELDRLQREMQEAFDLSPSIRGIGRGGFPALNRRDATIGGDPRLCSRARTGKSQRSEACLADMDSRA